MSIDSDALSVVFTGGVDELLDTLAGPSRSGTWRDFYTDEPDLDIHGFLTPDDLSTFVDAAIGPCLRLGPGVRHLAVAITEAAHGHQLCLILVYLTDDVCLATVPFDVQQLLPTITDDLAPNASILLRQIADRAAGIVRALASYVDASAPETHAPSHHARKDPHA